MTAKFVVRLLDEEDELLAWATVYGTARPQARAGSCPFFPTEPTSFLIEREGLAARISVHWCDLDVARQQALVEPVAVAPGQRFSFAWIEPVWLVAGMRDVPLPPVTVRAPVAVGVPTGSVTAKAVV